MKKFAYLFAMGSQISRSSETEESLIKRLKTEAIATQQEVQTFCWDSKPGMFMSLSTGEMIFNIS